MTATSLKFQNPSFLFGVHCKYWLEDDEIGKKITDSYLKGINAFQFAFSDPYGDISEYEIGNGHIVDTLMKEEEKYHCIHGCISLNLVGSKDFSDQEKKLSRVRNIIPAQLDTGVAYGCGVVFHTGSCSDREKGIDMVIQHVKEFLDLPSKHTRHIAGLLGVPEATIIQRRNFILENSAGAGDCIGNTLEEMEQFVLGIGDNRLHVCLDTAHLFGAGYDVSKSSVIEDIFSRPFLQNKLEVIHLNDSKAPLASRKDRHEVIGQGKIWSKSKESLKLLLKKAHERGVACVGEPPMAQFSWRDISQLASEIVPELFYIEED